MPLDPIAEVLQIGNRKDLAETGGGHGQKGIEYQRHWALMRMFQLEQDGAPDFLLLFEAIQDIAVLDSEIAPTAICVYQIKKKERKEWRWAELTLLSAPDDPLCVPQKSHPKARGATKQKKPPEAIKESPLGKLYATVRAFQALGSTGRFVSNMGCDLPLHQGGNAATSLPVALEKLSKGHQELLKEGLKTLHESANEPNPDLSKLYIEKVVLPVNDTGTHLVGIVHKFLEERSPRHAGQARALVDALLAKVSPLGAKTDTCGSFQELRQERGYSKAEFSEALGDLESVPDLVAELDRWLLALQLEGMGFRELSGIRTAAAAIFRRQLMGRISDEERQIMEECDRLVESLGDPIALRPFFANALDHLSAKFTKTKARELQALFALQALKTCVAQT
ncbi:dsDNA nuclease domain-containing protein [Roseomonas sp. WA12]